MTAFDQFANRQALHVARHDEAASQPVVEEVVALLRGGLDERTPGELTALLGHADRRVRLRAQWRLAEDGEAARLEAALRDAEAAPLARLHGLWGLGQLGAPTLEAALAGDPAFVGTLDDELRAQLAKVAGDARAAAFAPLFVPWLSDPAPRVAFFAAQALGALGHVEAVPGLVELLRSNDDEDPFLRHAAIFALHRLEAADAMYALRDDASRAVRIGALLVLRRAADPRIAHFLADPDPLIVIEAARAIYDLPIDAAMPALATLEGDAIPLRDDDPQTGHALARRIVGANLRIGGEDNATAIAAFAADDRNPVPMRSLALDALEDFVAPHPRDLTMSFWRPLPERAPEVVHAALDTWGPTLVDGPLGDRALEVALAHGRVPLDDAALQARIADPGAGSEGRIASLDALVAPRRGAGRRRTRGGARVPGPGAARERAGALGGTRSVRGGRSDRRARPRIRDPRAAARLRDPRDRAGYGGRRRAGGSARCPRCRRARRSTAARRPRGGAPARRRRAPRALARWEGGFAAGDLLGPRQVALAGGDPERGRDVYQSKGDCLRCHAADAGHGAGVGPLLDGIAARRGNPYVLES